jgi:hypothetical protein
MANKDRKEHLKVNLVWFTFSYKTNIYLG